MTPKQERFVAEYPKDCNATQAAIRAGYSKRRASEIGWQLLQKTTVSAALAKRLGKIEERAEVDAAEILVFLSSAMRADIRDILDDEGKFRPLTDWPKIWAQMAEGHDVDVEQLMERSKDGGNTSWDPKGTLVKTKFRFMPKAKIVELAMRHAAVSAMATPKEEHQHLHIHFEERIAQVRQYLSSEHGNSRQIQN